MHTVPQAGMLELRLFRHSQLPDSGAHSWRYLGAGSMLLFLDLFRLISLRKRSSQDLGSHQPGLGQHQHLPLCFVLKFGTLEGVLPGCAPLLSSVCSVAKNSPPLPLPLFLLFWSMGTVPPDRGTGGVGQALTLGNGRIENCRNGASSLLSSPCSRPCNHNTPLRGQS